METMEERVIRESLQHLKGQTESAWSASISGYRERARAAQAAGDEQAAEEESQSAMDCAESENACMGVWQEAIRAAKVGDFDRCVAMLERAAQYSRDWGDDSPEQEALEFIRALI